MSRRAQEFQTIRSEGGLLPPDLLRRVIDPRGSLKGTKAEDYGLPQGERLSEVITQSWNRLCRHWGEFRAAASNLPHGEAGTGLTNEKWSLPLLRELGFGLLPTSAGPEIAGRAYAISRFFGSVPIHLVGCGLSLDRRAAGVRGAAGGNPHGLVQEVLNRSPDHLWGIVSNGLRLRILRDNQALSRQSFLEFDLEAIFSAEGYSDFVLLWLVGHATRFTPKDGGRSESCWLEEWTKEAQEYGTRALKDLRGSVERALENLGEGFTSHPKNTGLREALRSGALSLTDFHAQLLRLVYRLIFLFVAEDRSLEGQALLHPRDGSESARVSRERYAAHYGTARLREMAGKIKGSRHGDLWRQFQILVGALSGEPAFAATRASLALPELGSFLWSPASTGALNDAELTNHDFLEALRHLAYTRQGKVLRPVDYRNLGAEELGGVYESLLALTPQISSDGARFSFAEFAGNERKTSGSYYTPDSLVQRLLDSALDPVVEEAIKGRTGTEAEQAILALKVCDPAVGSGHFLVGAAHRLARHLSRVRAQAQSESEPSPLLYQHALRDVIGRCLYGVDQNPMAAELCRVGLWLEALEPDKPLSFLDHHIRVGNSLLGTTPEMVAAGLQDEAFDPIEGDDKKVCAALKKRNRVEREGRQIDLGLRMVAEPRAEYNTLTARSQSIDRAADDNLEAIRRKAEQFHRLIVSPEYRHRQLIADAWCAAFVWPKNPAAPAEPITTDTIRRLEVDTNALSSAQRVELERLAGQYQFFHWHLAFPDVIARSGFDCMVGNPPWDMVELSEKEYFANRAPRIAAASSARERQALIDKLKDEAPDIWEDFIAAKRNVAGARQFIQASGRYVRSSVGRINLYPLFTELVVGQVNANGMTGIIVPSAISMDAYNATLFGWLLQQSRLVSLFDFENAEGLFPDVHRSYRFCLLCLGGANIQTAEMQYCYFAHGVADLRDPTRRITFSKGEIEDFSPNTLAPPMFQRSKDKELAKAVYGRLGVFHDRRKSRTSPWKPSVQRMLSLSDEGDFFRRRTELPDLIPEDFERLYSGKTIHAFNHRFATFDNGAWRPLTSTELTEPAFFATTEYYARKDEVSSRLVEKWPSQWLFSYRDISRATDERTCIAAIVPRVGCDSHCRNIYLGVRSACLTADLLANMNAFAFDYFARQKVIGTGMGAGTLEQLPVIPPRVYESPPGWARERLAAWLAVRVNELVFTAWDVEPFAHDCGWDGPPFRWDEERRLVIRSELDAAFFHLYFPADTDGYWRPARKADGCPRDETPQELAEVASHFPTPREAVAYIMDTFPIVRRKDEEKYNGDYRTKRVILENYDAMQEAVRTGNPFQTRLDPPPGPPRDVNGNFVTYANIASNPPPHIHLPRGASIATTAALQLSDLASQFPTAPFLIRLGPSGDARVLRVRPTRTTEIQAADLVVLGSPHLRSAGTRVPAAMGKLRVEMRTDANDGSTYVLVTVRGEGVTAQGRFSEDEWRCLTTIGVVGDAA